MSTRKIPLSEALVEVSSGVGDKWADYRVLGATRAGLALAREPVGKAPQRYKLVEPGTIFYNPMRIMIGSIAMLDEGEEPGITSPDYVVFRTCPGVLHPRWFYYWLRSKNGEDLIRSLARGAVRERLLFKRLVRGFIEAPDSCTQSRCEKSLSAVEAIRTAICEQIEASSALEGAYIREVFDGEDAILWPRKPLAAFATLVSGGTPSRGRPEYFTGEIPWVKTLDLNCACVTSTEESITQEALDAVRGDLLPVGTVMVAMYGGGGTIGKSGILGIPATTNQAICSVLPDPTVFDPDFLHYFLVATRSKWMKHSAGNRRDPNISKGIVGKMPCPLPPIEVQRRVSAALKERASHARRLLSIAREELAQADRLQLALIRASLTDGWAANA